MNYTYVLECCNKNSRVEFYVGFTGGLRERLMSHQQGKVKSTKEFVSIRLVYYEACLSKKDARIRELQLKTGFGRGYIKRRLSFYFDERACPP